MKYSKLIITLFSLLIISCKEDVDCDNLDWMDDKVKEIEMSELSQYFYITQAEYKNMEVYIFRNCCPFCDTVISVSNCAGESIGYLNSDIDSGKLRNEYVIWRPDTFSCTVN